ncbi:hypothetical protein SASPL_101186 [Salvia splendens]|uniref:GAG-pre-integrase domain-containing protein n=1 Tax=Salvia splendens TaxID=180675 RepID=A0A8X9AB02_SALSN|nr:hypothetical protein SASPL_101186 [Salvia splendens]
MLKGVRKNNLYYYQGSAVVGTVATATSSNIKDAEATKLWHLRLGYAGERSLQILAKQGLLKVKKVRCMLSNAVLDRKFWAEAITYAQHIVNRLPCSAIDGKTPIEVWSGKPATDYDSLRMFGSVVTESKLDPRAKKTLFMSFSAGVKGYQLWCLESKKTIVSRDVTFDESSMLNKVNPNSSDTSQQVEYTPKQVEFEEAVVIPTTNTTNDSPMEEEESDDEEVPPQEPSQQSEPIAVRRTRRVNKRPARFVDMVAYALPVVDDVPEEMQSLQKNKTWKLMSLPKDKKAIGCKWGFAKKEGFPDKDDVRYKARLLAEVSLSPDELHVVVFAEEHTLMRNVVRWAYRAPSVAAFEAALVARWKTRSSVARRSTRYTVFWQALHFWVVPVKRNSDTVTISNLSSNKHIVGSSKGYCANLLCNSQVCDMLLHLLIPVTGLVIRPAINYMLSHKGERHHHPTSVRARVFLHSQL